MPMSKTPRTLVFGFIVGTALAVAGVPASGAPERDIRPVRVTVKPVSLTDVGLPPFPTPVHARLAIGVDETGNVTDLVAVSANHEQFARVAVAQARTWAYQPASIAGQPYPSVTYIVVAVRDGLLAVRTAGSGDGPGRLMTVPLRELDEPLRAVTTASPQYPEDLRQRGIGGTVTVRFLIDQLGRVRLPHVLQAADPELAPLALAALEQWQFEPPRRRQTPVVVTAQQAFVFAPRP